MGEYGRGIRRVETCAIALFAILALWGGWRMGGATSGIVIAFAALAAWLATDFFSGLVHWAFDTWGSTRTPLLGAWFIRPFREHHDDPRAMARHDFVETNGSSAMAGLPLLVAGTVLQPDFASAFMLFLALGGLVANQCHKWAHMNSRELPAAVRHAQKIGLILRPAHHRVHHEHPHDSHYCTTSGWMNAPLEAAGFFRLLEAGIITVAGASPRQTR